MVSFVLSTVALLWWERTVAFLWWGRAPPPRRRRRILLASRPAAVVAHDLDLISRERLRVVHLERDVLDDEGPDVVAEAVGVEVTLGAPSVLCAIPLTVARPSTLKLILVLTFSAMTSARALSKFCMILIASCGSMRRVLISSSRVSISVMPMLLPMLTSHGLRIAKPQDESACTWSCGRSHSS